MHLSHSPYLLFAYTLIALVLCYTSVYAWLHTRPIRIYRFHTGVDCSYAYVRCHNRWQREAVMQRMRTNPGIKYKPHSPGPRRYSAQFIITPANYRSRKGQAHARCPCYKTRYPQ